VNRTSSFLQFLQESLPRPVTRLIGAPEHRIIATLYTDPTAGSAGFLALRCHPEAFALEAFGPRAFVNAPDVRAVVVLDRATGATVAEWALPEGVGYSLDPLSTPALFDFHTLPVVR